MAIQHAQQCMSKKEIVIPVARPITNQSVLARGTAGIKVKTRRSATDAH